MLLELSTAIIPKAKLQDYLLSPNHPIGRYKSAFFASLGYNRTAWEVLEKDIRALLTTQAEHLESTIYGEKYAVRSSLTGPNGRSARVVTIWIKLGDRTAPRFVTAYPEE
jgi:hypothetical protein